jgi:fumarate reductase subunit C
MSASGTHTHNPRALQQPVSRGWWLERRSYFLFMMRELSCVFVAWFVVYLLLLVRSVSRGETSYQRFMERSAAPGIVLLNVISLVFVLYHAVTFFNAAPQAIVVSAGGKRVPGSLIGASHYAAWAVVSAVVAWIVLGG